MIAIAEGERSLSEDELATRVDGVARYLAHRVPNDSIVGVTIDNRLESVELMLGVMKAGMGVLPLPGFLPWIARKALERAAKPAIKIGLGQKHLDPDRHETYKHALVSSDVALSDDGAMMFASSGTEGRPRLLLHDSARMMGYLEAVSLPETGFHEGAKVLTCAPMAVGAGMISAINTLNAKGTVILDREPPTAERWELTVQETGATASVVSPVIVRRLSEAAISVPSLRYLLSSAAALDEHVQWQFKSTYPDVTLVNFYSCVEAGLISYKVIEEVTPSLGTPFDGVDVRLRDEDELGIGTIEVRGLSTAIGMLDSSGYTKLPEWVSPEDYGQVIDGEIHLVGRRSDKIIVAGFTVFARTVEAVALGTPGVTGAAAVGVPSKRRGQEVHLFITGDVAPASVMDECARSLPKHAVPAYIKTVDHLPTSPAGKIVKRDLG